MSPYDQFNRFFCIKIELNDALLTYLKTLRSVIQFDEGMNNIYKI